MKTASDVFDFITVNFSEIVTLLFAVIGLLSQAAARFNLDWLRRLSADAHDAVQILAGNYGNARNAKIVFDAYRNSGPAAALVLISEITRDLARPPDAP